MTKRSDRGALTALVALVLACGDGAHGGAGADDDPADGGEEDAVSQGPIDATDLDGTLGDLGSVQPTVSSFFITNSGETLVYMSSAPITCELLMMEGGKWLLKLPRGAQVVEIVVKGNPKLGTLHVGSGGAEVNYAPGGMSSSHETNARSGSVTFTRSEAMSVVEGRVSAAYSAGNLSGVFHAEFCPGGQEY